jgi:hypothetical protein
MGLHGLSQRYVSKDGNGLILQQGIKIKNTKSNYM